MAKINKISLTGRLARALDLKARGLTDAEISERMKDEGYMHVSVRTINSLLNSLEAKSFVDELLRLQLRDITTSDTALRMKYRDRLLEKLMPKRIEQQIEGATDIRIVIEDGNPQLETPPRTEDDLA